MFPIALFFDAQLFSLLFIPLVEFRLSKSLRCFSDTLPKADNLAKIADYLNCSVDYLLGRTADPALENRFPDLTDEEWTKVEAFVTGLIANRR